MWAELEALECLSPGVWSVLASLCESTPMDISSSVFQAGHTQAAWITHKVFSKARSLPWSLCSGGAFFIRKKLQHLAESPMPFEPVAWKIWKLMQPPLCYPLEMLVLAIKLLGDCPWSTAFIEQLHASAATIHRLHPDYFAPQLLLKSTVHALNRLLPTLSPEEKNLQAEEASLISRQTAVC